MYADVVEYYGENARTLPPTTFFSLFVRFIKAFKVRDAIEDDDDDDDSVFLGSTQCRSLIQSVSLNTSSIQNQQSSSQ